MLVTFASVFLQFRDHILSAFRPTTQGASFEHETPCLADIKLLEVEAAKEFVRLVVTEGLLRVLSRGAAAEAAVQLMATELQQHLSASSLGSSIMSMASSEVLNIAKALQTLCTTSKPPTEDAMKSLNVISSSQGHQSSTALVKHCLAQNPFWSARERKI